MLLIASIVYLTECQPEQISCTCDCECPVFYVGGAASYVDTHFPQHQLVHDPDGVFKNKTNPTYLGWQAYGGIEMWWNSNWRFGAEVGYKNLAHFKTSYLKSKRDSFSDAFDGQVSLRYLHCTGLNLFFKGGAAYVRTRIVEDGYPYFYQEQKYYFSNIYPEITLGFGYYLCSWLNVVASWSHIFGPTSTSRYLQNFNDSSVTLRPAQAPGFDTISIGLEFFIE